MNDSQNGNRRHAIADIEPSLAAEITEAHALATKYADQAIEHAKRAGQLLLEVKAQLPHGEFLPWLAENVSVSERQAQRYMRAARGKPVTARQIKNDTVSHLPRWPKVGEFAMAETERGYIEVEPVEHAPDFYQFVFVDGLSIDYCRHGLRPARLEAMLANIVPPMLIPEGIGRLDWECFSADDDPLSAQIKRLDAMPKEAIQ